MPHCRMLQLSAHQRRWLDAFDGVNRIRATRQIERWGTVYCYGAGEDLEASVAVNRPMAIRFKFRFSPLPEPDNVALFVTSRVDEALEKLSQIGDACAYGDPGCEYLVGLEKEPEGDLPRDDPHNIHPPIDA